MADRIYGPSAPTEKELLELGRVVHAELKRPGRWPKVLAVQLTDHKRRLHIFDVTDRLWDEDTIEGNGIIHAGGWL